MTSPAQKSPAGARPAMSTDPIMKMLATSGFYKSGFSRQLRNNLVIGFALVGSVALNITQFVTRPAPVLVGMTEGGRLIQIVPLSKPFVSSEAVLQKVQKTATGAFSLDFDDTNLKAKLVALRPQFTRDGYASLMEQYDTSGLIEKIRTRRLVTSAVATGAGVIANEYEREGVYTWETEMPIAITITGQSERKTYECLVKQTVKRLPVEDNPAGIATQSLRLTCNTKIN
ncbi:DotI/IcmL/TraM family protein [Cupriavidus taiwanensis]|uniref:TraM-like protein similar to IcmL/DotI genes n=1 Tax=Cupriavidus taiwanensis TaxID=164546 RepID=A0A7Z7JIQ5_9BURK|nr:DotI/IcmL/TraM family protein [Cupriavidus taiwanensis]SOZ17249.1 TraM-like protein similar to IcmL/DotI genes [Cupriavidus taiwanensis]SOZ96425.1 TraM-like protein similar to IcmL/DotI genes [Cupriavidus taiwanensis]SPC25632.1 TraM-like protein similar to IcmL/DotI genes [Cupriavidus taiwanensis]